MIDLALGPRRALALCVLVGAAACGSPGASLRRADPAAEVLGEGRAAAPPPNRDAQRGPPRVADIAAPAWLDAERPGHVLGALAGCWAVRSTLSLRRGLELEDPPYEVRSWPLFEGRLLVERWRAPGADRAARGLVLRGADADGDEWFELSAWPKAGDAGWQWLRGEHRHGRLTWRGAGVEEHGVRVLRRRVLSDITAVSWRLDEALSADGGASWYERQVFEARRAAGSDVDATGDAWLRPLDPRDPRDDAPVDVSIVGRSGAAADATRDTHAALAPFVGEWLGTTRRRLADGSWSEAPCTWRAEAAAGGALLLAAYEEHPSAAGPGLRRVSAWLRLDGRGRRADGRSWEAVRVDDRSLVPFAFAGELPGGGEFVHAGRHGEALVRLTWEVDPERPGVLGWTESTRVGGAWLARVDVRLRRR